jgi:hypothetical protein
MLPPPPGAGGTIFSGAAGAGGGGGVVGTGTMVAGADAAFVGSDEAGCSDCFPQPAAPSRAAVEMVRMMIWFFMILFIYFIITVL